MVEEEFPSLGRKEEERKHNLAKWKTHSGCFSRSVRGSFDLWSTSTPPTCPAVTSFLSAELPSRFLTSENSPAAARTLFYMAALWSSGGAGGLFASSAGALTWATTCINLLPRLPIWCTPKKRLLLWLCHWAIIVAQNEENVIVLTLADVTWRPGSHESTGGYGTGSGGAVSPRSCINIQAVLLWVYAFWFWCNRNPLFPGVSFSVHILSLPFRISDHLLLEPFLSGDSQTIFPPSFCQSFLDRNRFPEQNVFSSSPPRLWLLLLPSHKPLPRACRGILAFQLTGWSLTSALVYR